MMLTTSQKIEQAKSLSIILSSTRKPSQATMKRSVDSVIIFHSHDDIPSLSHIPLTKRRRVVSSEVVAMNNENSKSKRIRRNVRFAEHLVQTRHMPYFELNENEKATLFYSDEDFARFAFNERIRRDTLILTFAVSREQLKRLRRRAPAISSKSVSMMFYKIFTRAELNNSPSTEDETIITSRQKNIVVARAA